MLELSRARFEALRTGGLQAADDLVSVQGLHCREVVQKNYRMQVAGSKGHRGSEGFAKERKGSHRFSIEFPFPESVPMFNHLCF